MECPHSLIYDGDLDKFVCELCGKLSEDELHGDAFGGTQRLDSEEQFTTQLTNSSELIAKKRRQGHSKRIAAICDLLQLSLVVTQQAQSFWKRCVSLQSRSSEILFGACVYAACRLHKQPVTLRSVAASIDSCHFKIGRRYKQLKHLFQLSVDIVSPIALIEKTFASSFTGTDATTIRARVHAKQLVLFAKDMWLDQGYRAELICAAAIELAFEGNSVPLDLSQLVNEFSVCTKQMHRMRYFLEDRLRHETSFVEWKNNGRRQLLSHFPAIMENLKRAQNPTEEPNSASTLVEPPLSSTNPSTVMTCAHKQPLFSTRAREKRGRRTSQHTEPTLSLPGSPEPVSSSSPPSNQPVNLTEKTKKKRVSPCAISTADQKRKAEQDFYEDFYYALFCAAEPNNSFDTVQEECLPDPLPVPTEPTPAPIVTELTPVPTVADPPQHPEPPTEACQISRANVNNNNIRFGRGWNSSRRSEFCAKIAAKQDGSLAQPPPDFGAKSKAAEMLEAEYVVTCLVQRGVDLDQLISGFCSHLQCRGRFLCADIPPQELALGKQPPDHLQAFQAFEEGANFGVKQTKISTILPSERSHGPPLSDADMSPEELASYLLDRKPQSHAASHRLRLLRSVKSSPACPANYDNELRQAVQYLNSERRSDL